MFKHINNFRNLGIDSSIDKETAQRIRLGNSMSIIGITTAFVVLFYSYFANLPFSSILLISIAVVSTFIPPILNSFHKTISARISFLVVANGFTIIFAIVFGSDLHFQYFLFALLGLPLLFFGNEIGRKKLLCSALGIIFFIYIECHCHFFEPFIQIDTSYSNIIRFVNDVLVGIMIFAQLYFFVNENDNYIKEINTKSNELTDKNTALEHFAYIASHDLKEPLRTVNSFVDVIKEEYGTTTDEELDTYFVFIEQSLTRMREMINGLLNYSQIGISRKFQSLDFNELLAEVAKDLEILIKEKKATIQSSDLPAVVCLKVEIKQLFQNLITNAIKFQPPDNRPIISISWRELPDSWEFCVADNGIGITAKKQKEIFQMFTKLHLPSKYEGYGIGLAFCKKIVELHNGKIWVESSVGSGSQFYFTIQKQKLINLVLYAK